MANSVSIRLRIDAPGADEVFQHVGRTGETTAEKIRVAFAKIGEGGTQARVSIERIDPTLQRLSGSLNVLRSRWDENYRAEQQMARAQDVLNRSVAAGLIPLGESEKLLARVRQSYGSVNDNLKQHTVATGAAVVSNGQMRASLTNLSFQVNDVVTGLASGQRPFQIFAQQSGQIFQIWQQAPGVFSAAGRVIASLITPTTAVVAGLATLAVGFGVVLSRASNNAAQLRQFDAVLRGLPASSQLTSAGLQKVAYDLRAIGVAAKEAMALSVAIGRNPAINSANPLAVAQIADLGTNVGSRLGIGTEAGITKTNEAIAAGAPAMIALGLATRALNAEQAAALSLDVARGKGLDALNKAIRLVSASLEDERKKVISASEAIKNTLGGAWDDMLNKLSNTGPIQKTNDNLTIFIKNLSYLFEKGEVPPDSRLGSWLKAMNQTPAGEAAYNQRLEMGRRQSGYLAPQLPLPSATMASPLSVGGALSSAASGSANISGLNTTFASRLDAWLSALPEAERATISITSAFRDASRQAELFAQSDQSGRMVARPGGSAHNFGIAADIRGMSANARAMLPLYGLQTPMSYEPWHVEPAETARANQATAAQRQASFMAFTQGLGDTNVAAQSPAELSETQKALARQTEEIERQSKAYGLTGTALVEMQARVQATTQAQTLFNEEGDRAKFVEAAVADALNKHNTELARAATEQDAQTQGVLRSIDAFKQSEAAGYRVIAEEEARIKVMRDGGNVSEETARILNKNAADAIQAGQKQVAAASPQVAAAERIAEATKLGTAAQREAELQAQAATRTQDALAKAEASRNPALIAQAKALNDAALAEVTRADAARRTQAAFSAVNDNRRTLEVIDLQTRLVGQSPADIERATSLLAIQHRLATDFAGAGEDARNAYRETATAIADARVGLIEAQRETERWSDVFRSIASSIESTLTSAVDSAFSGEKVKNWGERIRSMLSSALSTLTANLFIRPALGTIAGVAGFGNVASQLGTFGGSSSGSSPFSLSNASSVASLGNSFGLFDGIGLPSMGSMFGGFGSSLGFATPTVALSADSIGAISSMIGIEQSSLGFLGQASSIPGTGILGATTAGTFLGSPAGGIEGGNLLENLQ